MSYCYAFFLPQHSGLKSSIYDSVYSSLRVTLPWVPYWPVKHQSPLARKWRNSGTGSQLVTACESMLYVKQTIQPYI